MLYESYFILQKLMCGIAYWRIRCLTTSALICIFKCHARWRSNRPFIVFKNTHLWILHDEDNEKKKRTLAENIVAIDAGAIGTLHACDWR